jgi:hypothetical protein
MNRIMTAVTAATIRGLNSLPGRGPTRLFRNGPHLRILRSAASTQFTVPPPTVAFGQLAPD